MNSSLTAAVQSLSYAATIVSQITHVQSDSLPLPGIKAEHWLDNTTLFVEVLLVKVAFLLYLFAHGVRLLAKPARAAWEAALPIATLLWTVAKAIAVPVFRFVAVTIRAVMPLLTKFFEILSKIAQLTPFK